MLIRHRAAVEQSRYGASSLVAAAAAAAAAAATAAAADAAAAAAAAIGHTAFLAAANELESRPR